MARQREWQRQWERPPREVAEARGSRRSRTRPSRRRKRRRPRTDGRRRHAPNPGNAPSAPLRSTDDRSDHVRLTVLGAGPAYSDREGASGACYLVSEGETQRPARPRPRVVPADLRGDAADRPRSAVIVSHLHPDHFIDLVPLRHYLRYYLDPPRRLRVLGPGQLAARLDALHADPSFTSGALDTEPIGEEVHRIGDLEVVAGQGRPHRRQLRDPRLRVRLDGAGPRVQRGLRSRRRPATADPARRHAAVRGVVRPGPDPAGRAPPRRPRASGGWPPRRASAACC